jgi:hypothetical protein
MNGPFSPEVHALGSIRQRSPSTRFSAYDKPMVYHLL